MARNLVRFDSSFSVDDWSAIDDRVMGGISASRLRSDESGHAVFEGEVSLASGGGFASVRWIDDISRIGDKSSGGKSR